MIQEQRWQEVEEILDRVLEAPVDERVASAVAACAGDADLERAALAMLAVMGKETVLDRPVASLAPDLFAAAAAATGGGELAPGSRLGAYRILSRLGAGGMGEVYLAERADGQFTRRVALKVLGRSVAGPAGHSRFLRERQILAGLRHEHIAHLLDAGMTEHGRPFFILDYVDGEPVTDYCSRHRLDREQRIALFLQACDAVAYAHSQGIVHRDLKPSNLLVASGTEGRAHLYVLDFGIARVGGTEELTRSGELIGTPGYMAPEQARGEVETIDRRADVFALGVLLYELLCDRRPFEGATPVEVLGAVLAAVPASPRTVVPDLPHDLDTIVATCLEKDANRRYQSVHALADDLRRYLAGEPIAARPAGPLRRAVIWARRRPLLSGAALALLLSMAVGGVVTIREQRTARVQADLARRFGEEAERLSARLRFEHLAPLHDTTAARRGIAARLEELEGELAASGKGVQAAGRLALGRGRLALGDLEAALADLEAAWTGGLQTPQAALALAAAEAERYWRQREEAEHISDPSLRAARLEAIARRSRDRALELAELAQQGSRGPEGALVRARIAFLEGSLDEAGELAAEAFAQVPWLYEAAVLLGDIELARVGELRRQGAGAVLTEPLHRGLAAYRSAAATGQSDPVPYLRLCSAAATALDLALHALETDLDPLEASGAAACRAAAVANPQNAESYLGESVLETVYARGLSRQDRDPFPAITAAMTAAERALEHGGVSGAALRRLGDAWAFRAEFERERGIDAKASIAAGIAALEHATRLAPDDSGVWNGLGLVRWEEVLRGLERDEDFAPAAREAVAAFARAVELEPGYAYAWGNLGSMHNKLAEAAILAGEDPAPALEAAQRAFETALAIYPEYVTAVNNLGNVLYNLGDIRVQSQLDARDELVHALAQFDRAAELKPDWFVPRLNQARTGLALARALVVHGEEPAAVLGRALGDLEAGLALRGSILQGQVLAGEMHLFHAELERRAGRSPAAPLREVRATLERIRRLDPEAGDEIAAALNAFARGEPTGL